MTETNNYQILREHHRTDGTFKSLETLEMEYVTLTDKLIHKMTHGEQMSINGEMRDVVPTKVVFLDKSARPLAWLTKDLWDDLAPESGEPVPPRPDFKFLNIDRQQWLDTVDPNKTGVIDASRVPEELIIGLRSIFGKNHEGGFDVPNDLDNENIMIVDETKSTGDTLKIAKALLHRAFPTSMIFGTHWMGKQHQEENATGNADLPVWYKDDSKDLNYEVGRGVGNRRVVEGGPASQYFLSRRFAQPDQKALRLREDFKHLAASLGDSVPYVPYLHRNDESREKRSETINHRSLIEVELAKRAIAQADRTKDAR